VPCAGLSVTPVGSLFTVTNMVPGDTFSTDDPNTGTDPILVKVTNSPGTVTLQASNIQGSLSSELRVTVTEYQVNSGTVVLVDDQPLSFLTAPVHLQNSAGTTTGWATDEMHNFVISVNLPLPTDNTFQGTDSSFDLDWTRS
jgi:hypothetical protein